MKRPTLLTTKRERSRKWPASCSTSEDNSKCIEQCIIKDPRTAIRYAGLHKNLKEYYKSQCSKIIYSRKGSDNALKIADIRVQFLNADKGGQDFSQLSIAYGVVDDAKID